MRQSLAPRPTGVPGTASWVAPGRGCRRSSRSCPGSEEFAQAGAPVNCFAAWATPWCRFCWLASFLPLLPPPLAHV
eukprot:3857148-Lingulodinium_polyedra.AAC.1